MRVDLSNHLVHLTRGTRRNAEEAFLSIVAQRKLIGSSHGIRGGHQVVCFSEAPIEVLAKLFAKSGNDFRYQPFGVMVPKTWLYSRGGRPVIYQPESEFELLPEVLQYRHVRLDSPGTNSDYSFEREWRIHSESVVLDPAFCTLVVPDRDWDYRLRDEHDERSMRKAGAGGMNPLLRVSKFEWHVLALGDLGADLSLTDAL